MSAVREIRGCEVCGHQTLEAVLDLGMHPMCDDLVRIDEARSCAEYPIEILFCSRCVTAHQRFQVPKETLFSRSYHYRSRFTADVLNGMTALVASCQQALATLAGATVVDIGCNDGSLLGKFRDAGAGATIGVEPTDACDDARQAGHVTFNEFLSEEVARVIVSRYGAPRIVTMTNVFAHIEHLSGVLAALKVLMGPETVVVIENHYLGAVLERNQFDTFYHEHPRTYSYTSFLHIARSLGVQVQRVELPSRYGGNIRVFLGHLPLADAGAVDLAELGAREAGYHADFARLRAEVGIWRENKLRQLAALVGANGPLRAKAFPGRAAILIKLLGLDESTIAAVYEKPGSLKIGHFVPGTRIPIKSDDELLALGDLTRPILNLAWHIPHEIRAYLSAHGYSGEVVDVVSAGDFARHEPPPSRT